MLEISDTYRSNSVSAPSGEDGDFTESFTGKGFYQNIIYKADTVPLQHLFKHYGLNLSENNRKIICPFLSHKGGRESSASFYYYPHSNSFWCFGCKIGRGCCDFVSNMDKTSKVRAAFKIINLFSQEVDEEQIVDRQSYSERMQILMSFSNMIRNFRQHHLDQKSFIFIEDIGKVFDKINNKYDLSNEALKTVIEHLKVRVEAYELSPL